MIHFITPFKKHFFKQIRKVFFRYYVIFLTDKFHFTYHYRAFNSLQNGALNSSLALIEAEFFQDPGKSSIYFMGRKRQVKPFFEPPHTPQMKFRLPVHYLFEAIFSYIVTGP